MKSEGDPLRGARDLLALTPDEVAQILPSGDRDSLRRGQELIRIARALAILLPRADGPSGWLRRPNKGPLFRGRSPIDVVLGDPDGLQTVRSYLEAQIY